MNEITTSNGLLESAERLKDMIFRFKKLTFEIVQELSEARDYYKTTDSILDVRIRTNDGGFGVFIDSFQKYLEYIGLPHRTAYDYLERYDKQNNKLLTPFEVNQKKERIEQIENSKEKKKISVFRARYKTGYKPKDWKTEYETVYQSYVIRNNNEKRRFEINEKADKEQEERRAKDKQKYENSDFRNERLSGFMDNLISDEQKKSDIKLSIGMTASSESLFIDSLHEYLETLDSDNIKLETLHNVIKYCKKMINEYQQKSII